MSFNELKRLAAKTWPFKVNLGRAVTKLPVDGVKAQHFIPAILIFNPIPGNSQPDMQHAY